MAERATGRKRWSDRRGWIALGLLTVALVGAWLVVPIGRRGARSVEPELVLDRLLSTPVAVDDGLIVATAAGPGDRAVLTIDPVTAEVVGESRYGVGPAELVGAYDGFLFFHSRQPPDDRSPLIDLRASTDDEVSTLIKVDRGTGEIVQQYGYHDPPTWWLREVYFIDEHLFWSFGAYISVIDLRSEEFVVEPWYPTAFLSTLEWDGYRWSTHVDQVLKFDLDTGEQLDEYVFLVYPYTDVPTAKFKYHDGSFWVDGRVEDDLGFGYRFDPDTEELSDRTPVTEIPITSFESGGFRWEAYGSFWRNPNDLENSPDVLVWHQVDLASGESIAEYRFGEYMPRLVAGGYLWLTAWVAEAGWNLGRVPLS